MCPAGGLRELLGASLQPGAPRLLSGVTGSQVLRTSVPSEGPGYVPFLQVAVSGLSRAWCLTRKGLTPTPMLFVSHSQRGRSGRRRREGTASPFHVAPGGVPGPAAAFGECSRGHRAGQCAGDSWDRAGQHPPPRGQEVRLL